MNSKQTSTKKLVPKLRFPEFHNAEEWEEKSLDEVCDVNPSNENLPQEFIYIDLESVDSGKLLKKDAINLNNAPSRAQRVLKNEDIIFQMVRPYQKNNYFFNSDDNLNYVASTGYAQLRVFQSNMYLFQYIHTNNFVNRVLAKSTGSNYPAINSNDLSKIKVEITNPKEQQKIADCLSSLDELITAQSQKIAALKQHKKGLMQQLFPAEGQTTPKLRFPEFQNAEEWEVKPVEKYFNVCSSKRVLQKDWTNKGIPFYRTRELVSLSKNEAFNSEIYISEKLYLELLEEYGVPTKGDFLVSGVGTLGISYQVKANDKFYFKDGNVIWFKLEQEIKSDYFKYCFQSNFIQKQIFAQSSASTVGTYTIQNAKKTNLWLPSTKPEQQKIADCLSSLDELIIAQSQKIDALKQHKKGLMQNLFPS